MLKTYQKAKQNLYIREGGILCWGNPYELPENVPIFRKFLTDNFGMSPKVVEDDYTSVELDKETHLPYFMDASWSRNESLEAAVFYHSQSLDIKPLSYGEDLEPVGEIEFLDGICPGNDSLLATISDDLYLSCLQYHLKQLIHFMNIIHCWLK